MLFAEIDRLKAENEQLKQWEWSAKLLERKNAHLRALLNAVDEPALNFVTGSVIADARGPFLEERADQSRPRQRCARRLCRHRRRRPRRTHGRCGLLGRARAAAERPQQPHPGSGRACRRAGDGLWRQQRRAQARFPPRRRHALRRRRGLHLRQRRRVAARASRRHGDGHARRLQGAALCRAPARSMW